MSALNPLVQALLESLDEQGIAELADRLAPHLVSRMNIDEDRWMDSRQAAAYLGFGSVEPLKKLTAARTIPFEQDTPGGKCWFKRSELDAWRRGGDPRFHRPRSKRPKAA